MLLLFILFLLLLFKSWQRHHFIMKTQNIINHQRLPTPPIPNNHTNPAIPHSPSLPPLPPLNPPLQILNHLKNSLMTIKRERREREGRRGCERARVKGVCSWEEVWEGGEMVNEVGYVFWGFEVDGRLYFLGGEVREGKRRRRRRRKRRRRRRRRRRKKRRKKRRKVPNHLSELIEKYKR